MNETEEHARQYLPMAKALRLPGVKTFLLRRFHPDNPDADENQREKYTEALKTINAAYARADELEGIFGH